jgi:hypothetical protein
MRACSRSSTMGGSLFTSVRGELGSLFHRFTERQARVSETANQPMSFHCQPPLVKSCGLTLFLWTSSPTLISKCELMSKQNCKLMLTRACPKRAKNSIKSGFRRGRAAAKNVPKADTAGNFAFIMLQLAGFGEALRRVLGGLTCERTRWSSPRSSSSHCTVSPGSTPMAAAKAKGKLT